VTDSQLFDFAVPDELLQEAVSKSHDQEAVADVALMPGTGEGKPPALTGILNRGGWAPLILLTAAALVPGSFGNGISLIGNNLEHSFHIHDAALGAVTFVASVAQLLWAVPLALWADRGSRKVVAAVCLLVFSIVAPFMGLAPNVWWFVFLYLIASVGSGVNNTVHNSYLADQYETEGRGRVFSWHNLADPLSQTVGILIFGHIVSATGSWRWGTVIALAGIPIALLLFTLPEPAKGANESHHILQASGMDVQSQQEEAPRVLLGSAVTRLLRVKSLYYELVAVAVLGFAGVAAPLFGNLYFVRHWHIVNAGTRSDIYSIIGLAAFLGLPMAYVLGDRYFRKAPQRPLVIAAIGIVLYGGLYVLSLYMPSAAGITVFGWHLPAVTWVVVLQFLATAAVSPIAICIFLTLAATAPPEMRTICFAMFGVYSLVFGGFAGAVILGAVSDATNVTTALTFIFPVCALGGVMLVLGARHVRRDITLVIEDVLERFAEGKRRQAGGDIPALQVHNLDFFYGTNQVLFDLDLEVAQGETLALLGTNGAGKSTLLRAVSGLDHPHRGVIRLFGVTSTYLEPEQIIDQGVALLVGGKMTFPGLSVRDNLKVGGFTFRRDGRRSKAALAEALAAFPELEARMDQPAGTLSGGEQQMLALARVMMTGPRLLLIDELALGLAPQTVDRLLAIVRRVNAAGTTVILVEQSVNRAMSLAPRAVFLERGEIRFDGPTADLLARDDLLRPVFLGTASAGLG
jgi:ABC-type branched-subunit amino acid transport system ATPase component/sugar phosphate permease